LYSMRAVRIRCSSKELSSALSNSFSTRSGTVICFVAFRPSYAN